MLYFTTQNNQHIIVLEPEHLEVLKAGKTIKSPDKAVLIVYTHDSAWLGEQIIANFDNLSPELLGKLIVESRERPEKPVGPYHPAIHIRSGKKGEEA